MKIIIVGGSATGMGVAARLRRNMPDSEIVVYQKQTYVSFGACGLPYYVADNFEDPNNLIARSIESFAKSKIIVHSNELVNAIDFKNKTITTENGTKDNYDKLVIAVGAKPIVPNLPGMNSENVFTLTSLEDGVKLKEKMIKDKSIKTVAIIGAGFIGLETCEALTQLGKKIHLIEMQNNVMAKGLDPEMSNIIEAELLNNNIDLQLGKQLTEIESKDNKVTGIKLASGESIKVDAVLLSIGFLPNTDFIKNTELKMIGNGALIVNDKGETNIKDIYSAGDCATSKNYITGEDIYSPLATVASKFAKVVADNIAGKNTKFVGSIQSAMIRVFEKEIARTGLTESEAILKKIPYSCITINDKDHTNYVPNQADLVLKLIMNSTSKQIIGAQIIGSDKSILRINGIVSLIWSKAKVDNVLEQIDMPYAPPFSRSVDILHIALSKLNKE